MKVYTLQSDKPEFKLNIISFKDQPQTEACVQTVWSVTHVVAAVIVLELRRLNTAWQIFFTSCSK